MNIVIAMDSFKGSLSSMQAAHAVEEACRQVWDNITVVCCPMADGGEGTVDALREGAKGSLIELSVTGPLFSPVQARYAILPNDTAVIEISAAAGLPLVPPDKRDPLHTTSYGIGELIRDAIVRGCRRFLIGLGGSATNDGGFGMLSALGYEFLDQSGRSVQKSGVGLRDIVFIRTDRMIPELKDCSFRIACDVRNPLCGPSGCSAVFAPQKGASAATVKAMDEWLLQYSKLVCEQFPAADPNDAGAGAAGGLGYAFSAFLNGTLESGVQLVIEETNLEQKIMHADLVITGEGKLDGQSILGKAPIGVAQLAKKYGKPVIAFAGCIGQNAQLCHEYGIDAYYPITPSSMSLANAIKLENAYYNLKHTAYEVFSTTLLQTIYSLRPVK